MIEWLVVAGIAALFGNRKEEPRYTSSTPSRSATTLSRKGVDEELIDWRALWENQIDNTRWIPESTALRIVEQFPLPDRFGESPRGYWRNKRLKDLKKEFAAHNVAFLAQQKERQRDFFATVEKNPLTEEQMEGCICMDDALLIVAAAGSGKTSTMVAKAGYVLKEELAKPDQILMLAFNRDAANELDARVKDRLHDLPGHEQITARTFSAFGLSVIGQATGIKPSLAPWVEDGRAAAKVREIIDTLRDREPKFRSDWDFFRAIYGRTFSSGSQGEAALAQPRFPTADGKLVKSEQECCICNYLFHHGVNYLYEPRYEHRTATAQHRQYKPDFYYPEARLYHEHFALDDDDEAPEAFEGYKDGVEWKRNLHAEKRTPFFETTSGEFQNGRLFDKLKAELERRGLTLEFNMNREVKGPPPVSMEQLASTFRTFQQHVKANGLTMAQLRSIGETAAWKSDRTNRFLDLYERISNEWERELREAECIDFDDMLLEAIGHIESGRYESPFTVILADEFQDSSRARVRLLKALHTKAPGQAHVCVVGDDWQGINRFAGADISAMTNFEQTFDHSTRLMLATTFRCPESICVASSAFVQANPRQIAKTVQTTNDYAKKALFAFAEDSQDAATDKLEQQLRLMFEYAESGSLAPDTAGKTMSVMLLGRYHRDKPSRLKQWQNRLGRHLDITFRTIHGSKGLEADYVMILNAAEDFLGFPSQVEDEPILQLSMPEPDPFPHAEERRLFYVALTRAKRQVRIFTTITAPSRFIVELVKAGHVELEYNGAPLTPCPKCSNGLLRVHNGRNGAFEVCSGAPYCTYKRNLSDEEASSIKPSRSKAGSTKLAQPMAAGDTCPKCMTGKMAVRKGSYGSFLGCSNYPKCKTIADIG